MMKETIFGQEKQGNEKINKNNLELNKKKKTIDLPKPLMRKKN